MKQHTEYVAIEIKTGKLWIATYHPDFAQSWWKFERTVNERCKISSWPFWEEKNNFDFLGPLVEEKKIPNLIKW